jgi:hypothetical protein
MKKPTDKLATNLDHNDPQNRGYKNIEQSHSR